VRWPTERDNCGPAILTNGPPNVTAYTMPPMPLGRWRGSWGLWARGAHGGPGRRGWRVAVRARDGLVGGGSWGPRPGDELAGHVGGDPGATSCAGDPGARRESVPAPRRRLQKGQA